MSNPAGRVMPKPHRKNADQPRPPVIESPPTEVESSVTITTQQLTVIVDGVELTPDLLHGLLGQVQPDESPREVKKHLRCPSCWNGYGGKAGRRKWVQKVSGTLQKRCYSCDECGVEWIVEVRNEIVDDIQRTTTAITEVRS